MKNYYKNLKNIKAVNKYLEKINAKGFSLDENLFENGLEFEFDYDGWQNEEKKNRRNISANYTII